jgi:hypothetical protein
MWHVWRRGACTDLVMRPKVKRPLTRPKCKWKDNIKMSLQEVGYGSMDWIHLAQGRDRWRTVVLSVMNLRIP